MNPSLFDKDSLRDRLIPSGIKDFAIVLVQLVLFLLFLFWRQPLIDIQQWIKLIGLGLSLVGIVIVFLSIWQLRRSLRPYPSPAEQGFLITDGIYRYVRHPIYSGIILLLFGWGIYSESLPRVLISFALLIFFYFKSNHEERLLKEKFNRYSEYQKISGRFIPPWN